MGKGRAADRNSAVLERRAKWVMERWEDRPSMSYSEMHADVRAHFGCGKTAAEDAMAMASELRRAQFSDPRIIDRLAAKVLEIAEDAQSKGKHRDAIYGIEVATKMRGLHAPEVVEHAGKVDIGVDDKDLEALTDEQLAVFAAMKRKRT